MERLDEVPTRHTRRSASSIERRYRPAANPNPPPITTASGSSTLTNCAIAAPSACPAVSTIGWANGSPRSASAKTSGAAPTNPALAAPSRVARAGPEANCSNGGPDNKLPAVAGNQAVTRWRMSPSNLAAPVNGVLFNTKHELIPVPTVTYRKQLRLRPAPNAPQPARLPGRPHRNIPATVFHSRIWQKPECPASRIVASLSICPSGPTSSQRPTPMDVG